MSPQTLKVFEEIEIGDEIGPMAYAPSIEDIQRYAAVVRMVDQRFLSKEVAQERGFQHPIVPGPLSSTFLVRMLMDYFPGWRLQTFTISYRTPIRHGDSLSFWGTVTQKEEQQRIATIHCDVIVENGNGDRAIVGTAMLQPRHLQR
jgi:acyl dehydratase